MPSLPQHARLREELRKARIIIDGHGKVVGLPGVGPGELMADYVGKTIALGEYRPDWFLNFMGWRASEIQELAFMPLFDLESAGEGRRASGVVSA